MLDMAPVWPLLLLLLVGQLTRCATAAASYTLPYRSKTLRQDEAQYASPPRPARPPNSGQECGGTQSVKVGDHGVIESPGYPSGYGTGLDCEWRVEGPPDSSIYATLFDARTQNNLFEDVSDSLFLSLSSSWSDSQRYSGDFNPLNPLVLLSDANVLGVRFRSSRLSQGARGFKLAYYVTARRKPAASEPAHDVHTTVVCPTVPVATPAIFPCNGQSRSIADPGEELAQISRVNLHPFLVALILDEKQFCSGTLVSERHVVTSAHCTRGVQQFDMIFGTADISIRDSGVQLRSANASQVLAHPHFDALSGANDISVIVLPENVTFTRFVSRAELPSWNAIAGTLSDMEVETVGWGDTQEGTVYTVAGSSHAGILPNTVCRTVNKASSGLTMCSRPTAPELCQADSGSPVFTRNSNCEGCDTGNTKPESPSRPKPAKPSKPSKPCKPGKPSKPAGKPNRPNRPKQEDNGEASEEDRPPVLLGLISHGSCARGFSITRVTAYLDFLSRAALV